MFTLQSIVQQKIINKMKKNCLSNNYKIQSNFIWKNLVIYITVIGNNLLLSSPSLTKRISLSVKIRTFQVLCQTRWRAKGGVIFADRWKKRAKLFQFWGEAMTKMSLLGKCLVLLTFLIGLCFLLKLLNFSKVTIFHKVLYQYLMHLLYLLEYYIC